MTDTKKITIPNHTAIRVALWRALHVEADPAPHVLEDSAMAENSGFHDARHVSRADLISKYFSQRVDGLVPASGEELMIARV